MDTRTKIIPFEKLLAQLRTDGHENRWIVVPGLFDPMTAVQERRLAQYAQGKKLAVVVLDQPRTLLDAKARSELVAALRVVNAVSISALETWQDTSFDCETVAYQEAAERRLTSDFVASVVRRRP